MTTGGKPRRVLIVEDDPDARETLAAILEGAGYEVAQATHGMEAFEHLRRSPLPSLILLDLRTPWMDGWQFRAEQLKDPVLAEIPVVVLSGHTLTVAEGLQFGAGGYFGKPFDVEALLDTVADFCR